MTIKDVVEVLVHYSVKHTTFPDAKLYHNDADDLGGYCDHDRREIAIDDSMNIMETRQIVIHELVHAYMHINGIRDTEEAVNTYEAELFRALYPNYNEKPLKRGKSRG